jgi:hypothetical protein
MHGKRIGLNVIRLLLCGLLLVLLGCATTTGGSVDLGTPVNANKQQEKIVAVSTLAAYKAAVEALRELNMSITGEYADGASAEMKSKSADNEIVWVKITSISAVSCKVTVSVDVFATESRSRSILTSILKNLPDESTASQVRQIKDNLKQPENITAGTFQQPVQNEDDKSPVDMQQDELKPMPKEVVTEKSLPLEPVAQ